MTATLLQAHDAAVRSFFEDHRLAAEIFTFILPREVAEAIDMGVLRERKDRYTDSDLRWSGTDVSFDARMREIPVALYMMLDHQSSVDRMMPLRLWQNIGRLWYTEVSVHEGRRTLPFVLPMVLTNAPDLWTAPTDIGMLIEGAGRWPAAFADLMPRLPYVVSDLRAMTNEALASANLSPSSRLFLLALRNGKHPDIVAMFDSWRWLLDATGDEPGGLRVKRIVVAYLALVAPDMTQETMMHIGQTAGFEPEWIRHSFAWKQLQQGLAKGREEGLSEGLARGREEGREEERPEQTRRILVALLGTRFGPVPPNVQRKVNKAKLDELEAWTCRMVTAASVEDVFR